MLVVSATAAAQVKDSLSLLSPAGMNHIDRGGGPAD